MKCKTAREFYVYVYLDPRPRKKRAPLYVGKGNRKKGILSAARAWGHWQTNKADDMDPNRFRYGNKFLQRTLTKIRILGLKPVVKIIIVGSNENEAFLLECKLIKKYGRRDLGLGTLLNLTDGGEGPTGIIRPQEHYTNLQAAALVSNKRRKGEKRGPYPENHGANVSKALTGRTQTRETVEARTAKLRGQKRSSAFCAAASIRMLTTFSSMSEEERDDDRKARNLARETNHPEWREVVGLKNKVKWNDPEWVSAEMSRRKNPKRRKKMKVSMKVKWKDPVYREFVLRRQKEGRIAKAKNASTPR